MEIFITIICLLAIGLFGYLLTGSDRDSEKEYSYWRMKAEMAKYEMGHPKLSPEHESHNAWSKIERDLDELRYKHSCVDAIMEAQEKMWHLQKDKVLSMPPEEKLSWIPKWINYLSEHDERTDYDKDSLDYIKLPFDQYIACYVDETWYNININFPMRIRKGYIEYIP